MKQHGTIQLVAALLATIPSVVLGGESARLTIGGYVPPMQRVVAIQSPIVGIGKMTVVLQEQNNSSLGYTLTVESKPLSNRPDATAAFQINLNGQPITLTSNRAMLTSTPSRPGSKTAPKILDVFPSSAGVHDALVLTVASQ